MQPLKSIAIEFDIKESLSNVFQTYIGITDKSKDKSLAQSLINIFATNVHDPKNPSMKLVYNDFDQAFAVGFVFKLIVEQKIDLDEYIDSNCRPYANQNQMYALDLLKYIIYQIGKKDPLIYLNNILANRNIPHKPLDTKGTNLSRIYSFVYQSELGPLFNRFQQFVKYKFWSSYENQSINQTEIMQAELFFYQPSPSLQYVFIFSPILVLLKDNVQTIQYQVLAHHRIFLQNITIQLILDVTNRVLSQTSQNLKIQPFRFGSVEQLAQVLFFEQPNYQDKIQKFKMMPKVEKVIEFLIVQGFSYEQTYDYIKANQEQQEEQQEQIQQFTTQATTNVFDPFKTILPPPLTDKQKLRLCMNHQFKLK